MHILKLLKKDRNTGVRVFSERNLRTRSPSTPFHHPNTEKNGYRNSKGEEEARNEKRRKEEKKGRNRGLSRFALLRGIDRMRIDKTIRTRQNSGHGFDLANILTRDPMLAKLPRLRLGQDT